MRIGIALLLVGCGRIGFDLSSTAAGDANGDGSNGDAGLASGCNVFDRFSDDFEDGVTALDDWSPVYADPGTSYAEQGGDLVLTPATSNPATLYAGYHSKHAYDLRGGRVVVQVTQLPAGGAGMGLQVESTPTRLVSLAVYNNVIFAAETLDAPFMNLTSTAYDPATRFWAISERNGRLYFEVSRDGVTFNAFYDIAEPFDPQSVRVHLYAGSEMSLASPGAARYAAFNPGKPRHAGCPISMFTDDFADGQPAGWDESTGTCCTMQETGGVLQFSTNGSSGAAIRTSRAGYDLRGGAVTVRVSGGPSMTSAFDARLFVHRTDQNEVDLRIGGAAVTARTIINGTPNNVAAARTGSEAYLRIRETGGMLYFETSADKTTWSIVHQLATPFPVDDVEIRLQGSANTATVADSFSFDDLDL